MWWSKKKTALAFRCGRAWAERREKGTTGHGIDEMTAPHNSGIYRDRTQEATVFYLRSTVALGYTVHRDTYVSHSISYNFFLNTKREHECFKRRPFSLSPLEAHGGFKTLKRQHGFGRDTVGEVTWDHDGRRLIKQRILQHTKTYTATTWFVKKTTPKVLERLRDGGRTTWALRQGSQIRQKESLLWQVVAQTSES